MGALASRLHGLGDVATVAPLVTQIAGTYGVDPNLAMAVIKQESGFQVDPGHNPGDGYGLMQVTLPTAQSVLGYPVTAAALMDPVTNITAGIKYLAAQLARYGGNVADALAGYNGGSVRKNASGQYVNTQGLPNVQGYVDKVLGYYTPSSPGSASDASPVASGDEWSTSVAEYSSDVLPSWAPVAVAAAVILGVGLVLDL